MKEDEMQLKTIVVGYDDGEPSRRALDRAAEIAEAFGASLVITSVTPIMPGAGRSAGPTDPVDSFEKHKDELKAARDHLAGRKVEVRFQAAVGEPADTIVDLAESEDADLIVVGTREAGVVQRLLGQSVSDAVARHAHRDVLIVH
jgi:nucleotide-binding universal stress UspA family protein